MSKVILALVVIVLAHAGVYADSPRWPEPLVFVSDYSSSNVFFTMLPPQFDEHNEKIIKEPFGIAYRLNDDGKMIELYRTDGWYSFRVFVSLDGRYLVQMGPWNKGKLPEKTHLAVAFHKDGKLIKSYSTAEMIKDPTKIEPSVSHYRWLAPGRRSRLHKEMDAQQLNPKLSYDNKFTIHTIDEWTYEFDVTTGEISSATKTDE